MSWFDATGLASIAKSALKEAQKTIDKALDIQESEFTSAPIDTNDDFFGTWGLAQSSSGAEFREEVPRVPTKNNLTTSLWGSFTGSFFETPKEPRGGDALDMLDDGKSNFSADRFKESRLIVHHDDSCMLRESSEQPTKGLGLHEANMGSSDVCQMTSESGKNSSESVEILSKDTGCTTSPDSDAFSVNTPSSIEDTKHLSESVEIITESLITSPSSLEILDSDTNNWQADEFASPLGSPPDEVAASTPLPKGSPDSVGVIPEEPDEFSVTEDASYASASENTSVTVLESVFSHLKPQRHLKDETGDTSANPGKNSPEPITQPPSRSGMILPVNIRYNIELINTQPHGSSGSDNHDLLNLKNSSNIIDIPQDNSGHSDETDVQIQQDDDASHSDSRTMVASASDTIMESSSTSTSTIEATSGSSYVKAMLADAMSEKPGASPPSANQAEAPDESVPPGRRGSSPASSESLVKIGSGHTSGDEIETNASSDIEIISSPNGDSSSTQSRQSPAKQCGAKYKCGDANVDALLGRMTAGRVKGHNRELSEASSISDDSHSSEIDRLLKRVSEMTDILELRESKVVELNRRNTELQELNDELRKQLDGFLRRQNESADLTVVTEEYTQRLSALERKFQQAIREKDALRKQLEQSKQDAAVRVTKTEMDTIISDKDETIAQLRHEGEKLSKQQLQHTNIIKKLRVKEKEQEMIIKKLNASVEELSQETERLKRSLVAKDEVERTQIEAIHNLTAKNKKMENEINQMKEQLDDFTQKYDTLKKSHEAAKKELIDKNKAASQLLAREQLVETLENEKRLVELQKEQMLNQLDDMRVKMHEADQEFLRKEQLLRAENFDLLRRLEDTERRKEELSQSVLEVSKPLVKQLEALQSAYNKKIANFEKNEQSLVAKLNELQGRLKTATENEKLTLGECTDLQRKVSQLEQQLSRAYHETEMLKVESDQSKAEKILLEQDLMRQINSLQQELDVQREQCENFKKEVEASRLRSEEKHVLESEAKLPLPEVQERDEPASTATRETSPTHSLGKMSLSESLASNWLPDDSFDLGSAPRYTNMFEMQMLQTGLKQREGELQQLQWEMNRREQERVLLNSQIAALLARTEDLESKLKEHGSLKVQFGELQKQYDTLCQLFGEKVEENEELKLDLQDVKEMYKSQIDELLGKQKQKN